MISQNLQPYDKMNCPKAFAVSLQHSPLVLFNHLYSFFILYLLKNNFLSLITCSFKENVMFDVLIRQLFISYSYRQITNSILNIVAFPPLNDWVNLSLAVHKYMSLVFRHYIYSRFININNNPIQCFLIKSVHLAASGIISS